MCDFHGICIVPLHSSGAVRRNFEKSFESCFRNASCFQLSSPGPVCLYATHIHWSSLREGFQCTPVAPIGVPLTFSFPLYTYMDWAHSSSHHLSHISGLYVTATSRMLVILYAIGVIKFFKFKTNLVLSSLLSNGIGWSLVLISSCTTFGSHYSFFLTTDCKSKILLLLGLRNTIKS